MRRHAFAGSARKHGEKSTNRGRSVAADCLRKTKKNRSVLAVLTLRPQLVQFRLGVAHVLVSEVAVNALNHCDTRPGHASDFSHIALDCEHVRNPQVSKVGDCNLFSDGPKLQDCRDLLDTLESFSQGADNPSASARRSSTRTLSLPTRRAPNREQ